MPTKEQPTDTKPEEKETDTTPGKPADTDGTKPADNGGTGDKPKEDGDGEIDFDKELETLEQGKDARRTPLEKAQFSLKKTFDQVKEQGGDPYKALGIPRPKEDAGDESGDGDGHPKQNKDGSITVSPEQLNQMVAAAVADQVGSVRSEFGAAEVKSRIEKLTKSDSEAKVVQFHFDNTIKPSGDIDSDVENAYMIAHKGRIKRTFQEVARAAGSKDGTTDGAGAGQKDAADAEPTGVSDADRKYAESRGLKWDATANNGKGGFVSPRRQEFSDRQSTRGTRRNSRRVA